MDEKRAMGEKCEKCGGTGETWNLEGAQYAPCPDCHGSGIVGEWLTAVSKLVTALMPESHCRGNSYKIKFADRKCWVCGGVIRCLTAQPLGIVAHPTCFAEALRIGKAAGQWTVLEGEDYVHIESEGLWEESDG